MPRTTFETQIDHLDDEFEVPVELTLDIINDVDWQIVSIIRLDDGSEIIPTTDIISDLNENVQEHWDEIVGDAEANYADYRYEQARDERELEL